MAMGTYILIISLNVDGSNVATTKYRLAELIQKQDMHMCSLQETQFRFQAIYIFRVR